MAGVPGQLDPQLRRRLRSVRRLRANLPAATLPNGTRGGGRGGRRHGLRSTYNDGCRCDDCTDAETNYQYARKAVTSKSRVCV